MTDEVLTLECPACGKRFVVERDADETYCSSCGAPVHVMSNVAPYEEEEGEEGTNGPGA